MSEVEQKLLAKLHRILYNFEQNCHRHRIDALSEKQLTTKLATEKSLVATVIMALFQPTHPIDGVADKNVGELREQMYLAMKAGEPLDCWEGYDIALNRLEDLFAAHVQAAVREAEANERLAGVNLLARTVEAICRATDTNSKTSKLLYAAIKDCRLAVYEDRQQLTQSTPKSKKEK